MMNETEYLYFNPSGKWKYEGKGRTLKGLPPVNLTHDVLREWNDGVMPGITGDGKEFIVVVNCDDTYPRMVLAAP